MAFETTSSSLVKVIMMLIVAQRCFCASNTMVPSETMVNKRISLSRRGPCSWETSENKCLNFEDVKRSVETKDSLGWSYSWCPCCNITMFVGSFGQPCVNTALARFYTPSNICHGLGYHKDMQIIQIEHDRYLLKFGKPRKGDWAIVYLVCSLRENATMEYLANDGEATCIRYKFSTKANWICPTACQEKPTTSPREAESQEIVKDIGFVFLGAVLFLIPAIYCFRRQRHHDPERQHLIGHEGQGGMGLEGPDGQGGNGPDRDPQEHEG